MTGEARLVVPRAVQGALLRRGLALREADVCDDLWIAARPAAVQDALYRLMLRYSFRLVFRDVIRLGQAGSFWPEELARHAGVDVVNEHLTTMAELGLVRPAGEKGAHDLAVPARNLGPSLEWLVAEVLRRELHFEVARDVPLRGGTTGGDLDVVACAEGLLLYVEVKSGPPKHLDRTHVAAFWDRVEAVAPHGAIFFDDTELRMKDKIVVLFEEELARRGLARRPARLHRELFTVGPGVYIANAHPDMVASLAYCVSHLLRSRGTCLEES